MSPGHPPGTPDARRGAQPAGAQPRAAGTADAAAAGPPGRAGRVTETVEHLLGLQAQAPFPPYYGLWSRLDGFTPDQLATLISNRDVVRIALMRGTIHLVSAQDCLPLRRLVQPVIERG